jgi:hypothetical protein
MLSMNIIFMSKRQAKRRVIIGLCTVAALSLNGCDKAVTSPVIGAAQQQDVPAAFDTVAGIISAQGYELASCVAIADDKEKLACYAALGFKDKSDLAAVAALAGAQGVMAGERWQISAPSPGEADSFQGMAIVTFSKLANEGPMAFRNSRIELRCPANWGGPKNEQWSASIDVAFEMAYDDKERGTMEIDVDGKPFNAIQYSRSTFNVASDQAIAFRDAIVGAKTLSATLKTIDGKTGTLKAPLPVSSADSLKGYFAEFCR